MTFSNLDIFNDLRGRKIYPSVDEKYTSEVLQFFRSRVDNSKCHIIDEWVKKNSVSFKDYAIRIWRDGGRSWKTISVKNSSWLSNEYEAPDVSNCQCDGCKEVEDEIQVQAQVCNVILNLISSQWFLHIYL